MAYNPYTQMLMNQGDFNSAFNAAEAEINRDWSEYMSSTSHQRETQDLLAAGINPILSANNGAQWTAVGNGSSDASMAATLLNNAASLRMSEINAEATKAAAGATAGAMVAAAQLSKEASENVASTNYEATKYASDNQFDASEYQTGMNFASNLIGSILGSPVTSMLSGGKK